jgi:hypothetical protein
VAAPKVLDCWLDNNFEVEITERYLSEEVNKQVVHIHLTDVQYPAYGTKKLFDFIFASWSGTFRLLDLL